MRKLTTGYHVNLTRRKQARPCLEAEIPVNRFDVAPRRIRPGIPCISMFNTFYPPRQALMGYRFGPPNFPFECLAKLITARSETTNSCLSGSYVGRISRLSPQLKGQLPALVAGVSWVASAPQSETNETEQIHETREGIARARNAWHWHDTVPAKTHPLFR